MHRDLTREFLLACACCAWPPSGSRLDEIRTQAGANIDWRLFLQQVRCHRISGLAHNALSLAGCAVPPQAASVLANDARKVALASVSTAAEAARLKGVFAAVGIPMFFLKGPVLAMLAYGTLSFKDSIDLDLLVAPEHAEATLHVLEADGYALRLPATRLSRAQLHAIIRNQREYAVRNRARNVTVEVHWRAVDNPRLLEGVDVHARVQDVVVSPDITLPTLAQQELYAYLCVHGAAHGWNKLKWLADFNAFISSETDIARLHAQAAAMGAGLCSGQALRLCRMLFKLELPPELDNELRSNRRIERLVGIALRAMTGRAPTRSLYESPFAYVTIVLSAFLLGRGWRFHVAQIRVFAVGHGDVVMLPLPKRLQFLYLPLRPFLWLWRRWRYVLGKEEWYPR